jgi:aryl-alcohol dehydrogenase-like predicted oxidoreductase
LPRTLWQVRAGVSLSWVVLNTILLDTSSTAVTAALCASHGIKVIAAAPLAHGLISEAFLGVGEPDTASAAAPVAAAGVDGLAAGLDMVAR